MAVQGQRLEPGIVYFRFGSNVSVKDIVDAVEQASQMATEAGDEQCVIVSNFEGGTHIPFDLHNFKKLAVRHQLLIGTVTIGAPMMTQMMGRMIDRLTPASYANAATDAEAVALARQMLAHEAVT